MHQPTCPHCQGTSFELQEANDIQGAKYILTVVRCADCGAPIGVLEKENVGQLLDEQDDKILALGTTLAEIEQKLSGVEKSLGQIVRLLGNRP
jgi:hypothetical protein